MASQITDPKDFAQHIHEEMLAEFLYIQVPPIPFAVTGDKPTKKKRVSEDAVNRFLEAIKQLSDHDRINKLFSEMLYINKLSSERHIVNLEAKAQERGITIDSVSYKKCECYDERALWWYMHHQELFDEYFEKADTENLAGLREVVLKDEYILEKELIADEKKLSVFGAGVAKLYENTFRGARFKAVHFLEQEYILVRVYLENMPDNTLVFKSDSERQLRVQRSPSIRSLFSIIVVYNPGEKTLGIRSDKPSENVPILADLFCKLFLNCRYTDTMERKYNVENKGSVAMLELTPEPGSDIERCYLKSVEYSQAGDYTKTLRLNLGGQHNYSGTDAMDMFIQQSRIDESAWFPKRFEIKFVFRKPDGMTGKKRQITVGLSKRGANLGTTPEDVKIRQFLKAKGFIS